MNLTFQQGSMSPSQWRFLTSRSPYLCFAGGYGSGKSTALALKALHLAIANPGLPGLLIGQTYGAVYTNTVAELRRILRCTLPVQLHPIMRGGTMNPHFLWPNGSVMYLRSADNPGGYEGLSVAWVCGDEIRYWSRKAYDVAIARARLKNASLVQRAFASTPEMNWMHDEFNTNKEHHELIRAGTAENAHNLDPSYLDGLRSSYSPRLQRAILDGQFTILEGAVFDVFDGAIDGKWAVEHKYNPMLKTYMGIDPGFRKSSFLFVQEVEPLKWVVFDQLQPEGVSDSAAVQMANAKGYKIDEIWCDPAADATQGAFGIDTLDMLRGIKARSPRAIRHIVGLHRSITFGVDKLRTLLGNPSGVPPTRLFFSKDLIEKEQGTSRGVVRSLSSYRYPDLKDGKAVNDQPLKDGVFDHACLAGDEQVFVAGEGWSHLAALDGLRHNKILCADGFQEAGIITATGQKQTFTLRTSRATEIVVTGDHRFLALRTCDCGRPLSGLSWVSVLQMRALLLSPEERRRQGISAPRCLACQQRQGVAEDGGASQRRRPLEQHPGELGASLCARARASAHVESATRRAVAENSVRTGSSAEVAPFPGGQDLSQMVRGEFLEQRDGARVYLPTMWQSLSNARATTGQVLPPQLQNDCEKAAARCSGFEEVTHIEESGVAKTYCAYVGRGHSFVLRSGVLSHNCDSLRYLVVGLWLSTGLRQIDPQLKDAQHGGYKVAA